MKKPTMKKPSLKLPSIKRPALKRSTAKKPALKRPSVLSKGPQLKAPPAPQFLKDLHADLRDRHLLIPVLALIAAIVAVPFVLGGSEDVPPAAPLVTTDPDAATAVEPAVLAESTGIRSYRKRLAALRKKNPFDQQFTAPKAGQETEVPVDDGSASISIPTDDTASTPVSTDSPTSSTVPASPSSDPSVASPSSSAPGQSGANGNGGGDQIRFYAGRVDVLLGPIGETKTYEDVRYLDFLPDDKQPVAAFLGLVNGGDSAVFSLSTAVTETDGEGSCAPKKPAQCQYLTLKVGEERRLTYGDQAKTLRLKLLDTRIVRVPDPRQSTEP